MAKAWKIKAWIGHKIGKLVWLGIVVLILFGLWMLREPIMGLASLIGIEFAN